MIDESTFTSITEWRTEKARERFGIGGTVIAFILCFVLLLPLILFLAYWLG